MGTKCKKIILLPQTIIFTARLNTSHCFQTFPTNIIQIKFAEPKLILLPQIIKFTAQIINLTATNN